MGIERRPNLSDYWSINSFNYTPWYHELFPRDRFETLYSTMLHVNSIGDEKSKRYKFEPFLNKLLQNFQRAYYPDKDLSLDEMVVKWKGRSKFKMYNLSKPEKYHIKTFGLCDSHTGYAYNLLIYFGKETSYQEDVPGGQSEKIFQYLLRPLGSGHHVFANTNYTTHSLISYPSAKRIYYAGTLMSNRKNVPIEIKNPKIKHMESKFYRSRGGILLCMWKNKIAKKPVIVVSTHSVKEESEITNKRGIVTTKPNIIHEYSNSTNGCDRMDQMISYYVFNRKTIKFWKHMLMWCFEISQMNAFILFCLTREAGTKTVPPIEFKKSLITELITEASKNIPPDQKIHRIKKPTGDVVRTTQPAHYVFGILMIEIVQFVVPHNLEIGQNSNGKRAMYIYIEKIALKSLILKKNGKRDLCHILIYVYLRFIRVVDILHYK